MVHHNVKYQANWETRLEVFRLRNQGWEFREIGKKLGFSHQWAHEVYNKVKDLSVEEMGKLMNEQYQSTT